MTFLLAVAVFLCGAAFSAPAAIQGIVRSSVGTHLVTLAESKPPKQPPKKKPPKNVKRVKQAFTDWKASR